MINYSNNLLIRSTFIAAFFTIFCDTTVATTCSFCNRRSSFKTPKGFASPEGCEAENVRDQTEDCDSVCTWNILKTEHEETVLSFDNPNEKIPFIMPPGSLFSKGCAYREHDPSLAGSCIFWGPNNYKCFCNKDLCNKGPPPCSWIRAIDPENLNPVGCTEDESRISTVNVPFLEKTSKQTENMKETETTTTPPSSFLLFYAVESPAPVDNSVSESFESTSVEDEIIDSEPKSNVDSDKKGAKDEKLGVLLKKFTFPDLSADIDSEFK